jgi:hypothetical protein
MRNTQRRQLCPACCRFFSLIYIRSVRLRRYRLPVPAFIRKNDRPVPFLRGIRATKLGARSNQASFLPVQAWKLRSGTCNPPLQVRSVVERFETAQTIVSNQSLPDMWHWVPDHVVVDVSGACLLIRSSYEQGGSASAVALRTFGNMFGNTTTNHAGSDQLGTLNRAATVTPAIKVATQSQALSTGRDHQGHRHRVHHLGLETIWASSPCRVIGTGCRLCHGRRNDDDDGDDDGFIIGTKI